MNFARTLLQPIPAFSRSRTLPPQRGAPPREPVTPRANLDGLEVQELTLADWLAAGGERRSKPRAPKSAAATA